MAIGAIPQLQQPDYLKSLQHQPRSADNPGNILPLERLSVEVDISESGRLALEHEMQHIAEAHAKQEFVDLRGDDGAVRLGLMALGNTTLQDWSAKGLELTEESIIVAGKALQEAFRKNLEDNGAATAGTAIALNRHQLVINSQTVPDWFVEEYESALLSMNDSELKRAFSRGETFVVSQPTASDSDAVRRYTEIKHSL